MAYHFIRIGRIIILAVVLASFVSLLLSQTTLLAEEWKTDKGTPIPHYRLDRSTDPDTLEIYDGKNKDPVCKIQKADPNPSELNKNDFDFNKRTEDFTQNERDEIKKEAEKDYPNIQHVNDPTKEYNCHGFTFGGSKVWINDPSKILADQGYQQIQAGNAQPGDIIVYKKNGQITHTGKVDQIDPTKNDRTRVTQGHSKWGQGGEIKHKPNDVPSAYGDWEIYRDSLPAPPAYAVIAEPVTPGGNITSIDPSMDYLVEICYSSVDLASCIVCIPVFPNWYSMMAAVVAAGGLGYLIWRRRWPKRA